MRTKHKHCEIIKAWADGAEIQKFCDDGWYDDSDTPEWYEDAEYRIKPRTVKREGWVNVYRHSHDEEIPAFCCLHPTEEAAKNKTRPDIVATVKIEWEEVE